MPSFKCLYGRDVPQIFLGDVMIVQADMALQGGHKVGAGIELVGLQDIGDTAVEAFYHPVGLWPLRARQPMFDVLSCVRTVKTHSTP